MLILYTVELVSIRMGFMDRCYYYFPALSLLEFHILSLLQPHLQLLLTKMSTLNDNNNSMQINVNLSWFRHRLWKNLYCKKHVFIYEENRMINGNKIIRSWLRCMLSLSEVGVVVAQVSLDVIGFRGLEPAPVFTILASFKSKKKQSASST